MKKKIIIICGSIVFLFICFNSFWYFTTYSMYDKYIGSMQEYRKNISYVLTEDGYNYNVKYPFYLSFTGNLCVASEDDRYALIIWPSFFEDTKYGVQIVAEDGLLYSIMIDEDMNSIDSEYGDLISNYKTDIEKLFQKADERWDLK